MTIKHTPRANSKAARIARLHKAHPELTTAELSRRLGITKTYVSSQLWHIKKAAEASGQPATSEAPDKPTVGNLTANDVQMGGDHYRTKAIQPWDFIIANDLGFLAGNVVKYLTRYKDKNGVADLEKARHYLDKLIETERK